MADSDARDLLISMASSGFNRGQDRNTTVVVGNVFYLTKPGQLGPVESHFGASVTVDYCTQKFFSTRERKKASLTAFRPCLLDRCKRKPSGWGEERKKDLFEL